MRMAGLLIARMDSLASYQRRFLGVLFPHILSPIKVDLNVWVVPGTKMR